MFRNATGNTRLVPHLREVGSTRVYYDNRCYLSNIFHYLTTMQLNNYTPGQLANLLEYVDVLEGRIHSLKQNAALQDTSTSTLESAGQPSDSEDPEWYRRRGFPIDREDAGENNIGLEGRVEDTMDQDEEDERIDDNHDMRRSHRSQDQRNNESEIFVAEVRD